MSDALSGHPEHISRLQAWVERRSRDLLRMYGREGAVHTRVPEDGATIAVHACLEAEHRRVEGPTIRPEAIELEDGRQALIALTGFILRLPRVSNAGAEAMRLQAWIQTRSDELLVQHGRQGHLLTTRPEGPSAVRVWAYLAEGGDKLEGPEIPYEWIALDNGRRAEGALEAFILSLPVHALPSEATLESDPGAQPDAGRRGDLPRLKKRQDG